jgi:hypothetical protein
MPSWDRCCPGKERNRIHVPCGHQAMHVARSNIYNSLQRQSGLDFCRHILIRFGSRLQESKCMCTLSSSLTAHSSLQVHAPPPSTLLGSFIARTTALSIPFLLHSSVLAGRRYVYLPPVGVQRLV